VLAAAVCGQRGEAVFTGDEPSLLASLDAHLRLLSPGVLVTWNGAAFDLPYLADRAETAGVRIGLRLVPDPSIPRRHAPLAGHSCPYRARWHGHVHLDAYQAFKWAAGFLGVSCSLKSVARMCGLDPLEVDTSTVHLLDHDALLRYVASDARTARQLAERRWDHASRFLDVPVGRAS